MFRLFLSFLKPRSNHISTLLPQNIVNPTAGGSGSGHHPGRGAANSAEDPSHALTNIRDLLQVINIVYQLQFCYLSCILSGLVSR